MPGWEMRFDDSTYRPLKEYVASAGGARLALHSRLRDRLVDMAVEEFPLDADPDRVEEILRARMRVRIRRQYGSILASILIGVLVNLIVKVIVQWWKKRNSHKVLMEGWQIHAMEATRVQVKKSPKA